MLRSSAVTDVSQLAGKTIAIYDDPAAERWVKQNIPGARVKAFSGDSGWFEALERREADALVYDYPFAAEEIKSHPRTKIVQFNLNQSRYAVGVPAGNDDLLDAVNGAHRPDQGLRGLRRSGAALPLLQVGGCRQAGRRAQDLHGAARARRSAPSRAIASAPPSAGRRSGRLNRERIANPHLIYPDYVLIMP